MVDDFDIVIFGGVGDLAIRKLLPALYRCEKSGVLSDSTRVFVACRSEMAEQEFSDLVCGGLESHLNAGELDDTSWQSFYSRLTPVVVEIGELDQRWDLLADHFSDSADKVRVFYFAIPPSLYGTTCENLNAKGLVTPHSRVVLEKPIGYDIESARVINEQVARYFDEEAIYRIDHYLGKETVQNLMALRFSNVLFEELWNNKSIDHVQISLAETVGLEGRAGFYDKAGALRDMVQNHLLQLLCLVAMEPPHKLDAENIRAEKLKVLKSLSPITAENVTTMTQRGQYVSGAINGKRVPGYLDELDEGCLDSTTETYVALRVDVGNWRWAGVPFYLRTGKRLKQRVAEIVVQFKPVSHNVFDASVGKSTPNRLIIRLQPDEGIQLTLMAKELNRHEVKLKEVALNLNFVDAFDGAMGDAYQRLLLDVAEGNPSLFIHRDEVEEAWAWINPILEAWENQGDRPDAYYSGTWGPDDADELMQRDGREWLQPDMAVSGS